MPPASSVAWSVTATSALFQPAPFGAGADVAVVVGAALSTVTLALPLIPPELAEMVVVPLARAVARPPWLIDATLPLLLDHETAGGA